MLTVSDFPWIGSCGGRTAETTELPLKYRLLQWFRTSQILRLLVEIVWLYGCRFGLVHLSLRTHDGLFSR
jgi:hypothetical protein